MKKNFVIAAMMLMVSTAAMADNAAENVSNALAVKNVDYSFVVNNQVIARNLGLSEMQEDQMDYVFDRMNSDLRRAKNTKDEEKRNARVRGALVYNLSAAHSVLNDEQYHKYLVLLNTTLQNKGLDAIFYGNELAME